MEEQKENSEKAKFGPREVKKEAFSSSSQAREEEEEDGESQSFEQFYP